VERAGDPTLPVQGERAFLEEPLQEHEPVERELRAALDDVERRAGLSRQGAPPTLRPSRQSRAGTHPRARARRAPVRREARAGPGARQEAQPPRGPRARTRGLPCRSLSRPLAARAAATSWRATR